MSYLLKPLNEQESSVEYNVSTSTNIFPITFKTYPGDNIHVTLDGKPLSEHGVAYDVNLNSNTVYTSTGIVGTVRVYRETDIDQNKHTFSSGAVFNAKNMDANFEQIRHAQQEVRTDFNYLEYNTLGVVEAAKEATDRANEIADEVEGLLEAEITHNKLRGRSVSGAHPASAILDGGKNQHNINLPIINYVNPKVFGAVGDGISDDTQAIKACFNFMLANGAIFYDYSESSYLFTSDVTVEAPNKTVNIQTNCKLVSDTSILRIRGAVEEIGTITTTANKGSKTITSSISVNAGDVIAIHNTVNNSFFNNAFAGRGYYKDGEFKTVESVSGGVINFTTPLESSYTAAATNKIYKVNPVKCLIDGLAVEAHGLGSCIISMTHKSEINMKVKNLLNRDNSRFAFQIDRAYDCRITGGEYIKKGISVARSTDYGLAISNCQDLLATPSYCYGGRHASAVGGDVNLAAVPNRRVYIENAKLENDPTSELHVADFHGNTADSHYKNCHIYGRINLSGYSSKSINNKIYMAVGEIRAPIGYTEVIGGNILSIGDEVLNAGDSIYVMGWTTSLNPQFMTEKAVFGLIDITVHANTKLVGIFSITNTPVDSSYIIDGFNVVGELPESFNRVYNYQAGATAKKPVYIQATRPNFNITDAVTPISGDGFLAGISKRFYELSGSSANGSWTRLSDGTMICRAKLTATLPITTAVNGGFKSENIQWTYPKPFVGAAPSIDAMSFDNSSASIRGTSAGSASAQLYSFATVSIASAGINFDVKAIGRYLY